MEGKSIPNIVVGRLPVYLRALQRMIQEGRKVTSSQELGERLGISAAQIRKDLSQFGEFGKQGTGYNIEFLSNQLQTILKVDRIWDVAIIGAGDIGGALARYQGLEDRGFHIKMVFDNDESKIGSQISGFVVQDATDLVSKLKKGNIKIVLLSVPAASAQSVADQVVEAGVQAILNYAPISVNVPEKVRVQHIDPVTHLQHMTYYL
jgi:redox-sensing transcriptional repressor